MPEEIKSAFLATVSAKLEKTCKRNAEWIGLASGMLYYYGMMNSWQLIERISSITGKEVDFCELYYVMKFA